MSVACSVLYRPFSELDLDEPYGAPPESAYYAKLVELIDATEAEVARTGGTLVRTAADLEREGQRYVHCVEGGFHLGATPEEVTAHVHELADRGVLYITLAHLFWRGVASQHARAPVPAGRRLQPRSSRSGKGVALSPLGEAAVARCTSAGSSSTSATCATTRSTRRSGSIEALDRQTGA